MHGAGKLIWHPGLLRSGVGRIRRGTACAPPSDWQSAGPSRRTPHRISPTWAPIRATSSNIVQSPPGRLKGHHTSVAEQSPVWRDWCGLVRDPRAAPRLSGKHADPLRCWFAICGGTLERLLSLCTGPVVHAGGFLPGPGGGPHALPSRQSGGDRGGTSPK